MLRWWKQDTYISCLSQQLSITNPHLSSADDEGQESDSVARGTYFQTCLHFWALYNIISDIFTKLFQCSVLITMKISGQ